MSADKPILCSVKPLVVVGIGEVLWDVYPDSAHFGGAPANFVSHAASLGAESWMVSAVGADEAGEKAMRTLASLGVRCDLVARDPQHPTGEVRVMLDAQRVPTYTIAPDSAWDHIAWSDELSKFAARCDAVCFGTLAQRSPESRATIRRFLEEVPRTALRIFDVNLRQRYYDPETIDASLRLASAVKMNEEELAEISTLLDIVRPTRRQVMRRLMDRYDLQLAALTRGPEGALLFDETDEDETAAPGTIVMDTVGAGDAFTAAMVVDYLRDLPLPLINRHANAVAALVCSQIGGTPLPRSSGVAAPATQQVV
jgi:fructokinase